MFGAVCWCSLILLPWCPWGVREKIEKQDTIRLRWNTECITVLIPARNEDPYIWHTLNGVRAQSEDVRIIVTDETIGGMTLLNKLGAVVRCTIRYNATCRLEREIMGA